MNFQENGKQRYRTRQFFNPATQNSSTTNDMSGKATSRKWFWGAVGVCFVTLIVWLALNRSTSSIPQPSPATVGTSAQPNSNPLTGITHSAQPKPEANTLSQFEAGLTNYKALWKQTHGLKAALLSEHPEIPAAEEYLQRLSHDIFADVTGEGEWRALMKKNPKIYRGSQDYLTAYHISNALRSTQRVANTSIGEMVAAALSDPKTSANLVRFLSSVTASMTGNKGQVPATGAPLSATEMLQLIDDAAEKHRSHYHKMLLSEGAGGDSPATAYIEAQTLPFVLKGYISAFCDHVSPEELLKANREFVNLGAQLGNMMSAVPADSDIHARMMGLWNELRSDPDLPR